MQPLTNNNVHTINTKLSHNSAIDNSQWHILLNGVQYIQYTAIV